MGKDADDASQAVSDDELDRAASGAEEEVGETEEGAAEEVAEEEAGEEEAAEEEAGAGDEEGEEEEDVPDEPEDNAERSKLGRKVQELEAQILKERTEGDRKLTAVLDRVDKLLGKQQAEDEEEFVMPETREELKSLMGDLLKSEKEKEAKGQTEKASEYQSDYVDTVLALVDNETPEVRDEIIKKLNTDEFGSKHSENGTRDAARNVTSIIRSLSAPKEKKVPVKGAKPRAPLGGGGGDKAAAKTVKIPKLDAAAQEFVNSTKMSEEDQAAALNGDAPAYIAGSG